MEVDEASIRLPPFQDLPQLGIIPWADKPQIAG
jgi:hypothetical protein